MGCLNLHPVATHYLRARFLFLRLLGVIFFSAFYSLAFQVHALIGPGGIRPAEKLLAAVREGYGLWGVFQAPSLLWLGAGDTALNLLVAGGLAASVLLLINIMPRAAALVASACFLSFVSVAREFASYQSDGMLMEAGLLAAFLAPNGLRPGLGAADPPGAVPLFLLQWEWLRIVFGSGIVKVLDRRSEWWALTALDHYYEYGPLPTWIGWYAQHLPLSFHHATTAAVLVVELVLVWMVAIPRRLPRLVFIALFSAFQVALILTANYAFLNYLVFALGLLFLDDPTFSAIARRLSRREWAFLPVEPSPRRFARARDIGSLLCFAWLFLASVVRFPIFPAGLFPDALLSLVEVPAQTLEPFRLGERYGLFARMTDPRFELEFQATTDGEHWVPYLFRYKPQALDEAPGIYAPYQPRFEWNLWFAQLSDWNSNRWVILVEEKLMARDPAALSLFRGDPLNGAAPKEVRLVKWQYWFTDIATQRATKNWWRREFIGLYAPTIERKADGSLGVGEMP